MSPPLIENVSDTARWVAVYRAMESERPDALFRDPWARRLAGERGEAILRGMPRGRSSAWAMIVRTQLFDEILLRLVRERGATQVINLAAGFDTRPLRLPLPPATRWIEADLPPLLTEKEELLAGEPAVCDLERVKIDLAEPAARQALFARLGAEGRPTAVAAEGLLIYLSPQQVGELAADLYAQPAFRWWIVDLAAPQLLKMMQRSWGRKVAEGGAPFRFAPAEGPEFFRAFGWRPVERRSTWDEARLLRREMPFAGFFRLLGRLASKEKQELYRRLAEIVLLERV